MQSSAETVKDDNHFFIFTHLTYSHTHTCTHYGLGSVWDQLSTCNRGEMRLSRIILAHTGATCHPHVLSRGPKPGSGP